jgi:hypothetical protein
MASDLKLDMRQHNGARTKYGVLTADMSQMAETSRHAEMFLRGLNTSYGYLCKTGRTNGKLRDFFSGKMVLNIGLETEVDGELPEENLAAVLNRQNVAAYSLDPRVADNPQLGYRHGDTRNIPFRDKKFQHVISVGGFDERYIRDVLHLTGLEAGKFYQEAAREIKRVLWEGCTNFKNYFFLQFEYDVNRPFMDALTRTGFEVLDNSGENSEHPLFVFFNQAVPQSRESYHASFLFDKILIPSKYRGMGCGSYPITEEMEFLPFFEGQRVLNIGLETDYNDSLAKENVVTTLRREGLEVIGLDPQVETNSKRGYVRGSVTDMPFEDGEFDSVISVGLFDAPYVRSSIIPWLGISEKQFYEAAAREIGRVTRSQGHFYQQFYYELNKPCLDVFTQMGFEVDFVAPTTQPTPRGFILVNS